jgi:putative phage-type endonuclease
MRVVCGSQGTAEWLDSRRGLITASRIKDVMNVLRNGGEGAGRRKYRNELAMERLTGLTASHYVTPAMQHGTEYEPIARATYELERDVVVESVGLVLHPTLDYAGASPDGITDDRAIEIKAPQEETFIGWIQEGLYVPEDHQPQCLWVMECCQLDLLDFIAYHPRMKPMIVPMRRDEARIAEITQAVIQFNEEVEATMDRLREWVIPVSRDSVEHAPEMQDWATRFAEFTGMDEIPL